MQIMSWDVYCFVTTTSWSCNHKPINKIWLYTLDKYLQIQCSGKTFVASKVTFIMWDKLFIGSQNWELMTSNTIAEDVGHINVLGQKALHLEINRWDIVCCCIHLTDQTQTLQLFSWQWRDEYQWHYLELGIYFWTYHLIMVTLIMALPPTPAQQIIIVATWNHSRQLTTAATIIFPCSNYGPLHHRGQCLGLC